MNKIRVAILDDHQSIIDGYLFRLNQTQDVQVVGTAFFAEELENLLAQTNPDVLILDIHVPTSPNNTNPYPILHTVPKWLQAYSHLAILVISMLNRHHIVRAVMDAGVSGYVLKDDRNAIAELGNIVRLVAQGGMYLSQQVRHHLILQDNPECALTPRQVEVLSLCSAYPDASTGELANMLGTAHSTLRNLLSEVYLRLDVHSRTSAIAKAIQLGWIASSDSALSSTDNFRIKPD